MITLTIQTSKNINDNKRFWTTHCETFFTDKSKMCNNIILNENDKTKKDGKEIANKFNKYFENIVKKLNLKKDTGTSFEFQESCRMIKMNLEKKISLLQSLLKTQLQMQLRIYL